MNIQPQYVNLEAFFHKRLFRIPEYQRAYSWERKHRYDLFNDIKESHLAGNSEGHFMSTVVCLRKDKTFISTDEYQALEIVDGQQRVTTLILLFRAIVNNLDSSNEKEHKIRNEILDLLVKPDQVSLLLLQTNHDTSGYFADYLRKGNHPTAKKAKTLADHALLTAMEDCEKFVVDWKSDKGSLDSLVRHIKNRLSFILHEISDERMVYTVFEVLNSRGLDVSWFDRLKSMLMAVIFENSTGNKEEILTEVREFWSQIYHIVGLRLGMSTEALRFAATLKSPSIPYRPLSAEVAAKQLRDQTEDAPDKVIEISEWIKSVTKAVDRLMKDSRRNAVTKIVQARIVAVAVYLRSNLRSNEKTQILKKWESVTFRIYGLHGSDARKCVGDYVSLAWRIVNENLNATEIMEILSAIGESYPLHKSMLYRTNCYEGWEEELRYFICKYEEYLSREAGQKFDNKQWIRIWEKSASDSIEHILPQSSKSKHRHWLGNLMILPPGLNSGLRDKKPKDKAEDYIKTGLLSAQQVGNNIKKSGKWLRRDIIKRETQLIEWAMEEWKD